MTRSLPMLGDPVPRRGRPVGWLTCLTLVAGGLGRAAAEPAPAELLAEIAGARLVPEEARHLEGVRLTLPTGQLVLIKGTLVPATRVGGTPGEFAFIGRGRLEIEPPDAIERDQLTLFTGSPRFAEEFTEAVLALTLTGVAERLLARGEAATDPAALARARSLFDEWLKSPERRLLQVENALLSDAVGDPLGEGYVAGWFAGNEDLGRFVLLIEPRSYEQVSLGQFVSGLDEDVTESERSRLRRLIAKEQRRGRLIGIELEDLGQWDTWLSAAKRSATGDPTPGGSAFDIEHYSLQLDIAPRTLELRGTSTLRLRSHLTGSRALELTLAGDLRIDRAMSHGREQLVRQQGDVVLVVFADPPPAEELFELELTYRGQLIDEAGTARVVRRSTGWYPTAGAPDYATYDVRLRWPRRWEMVGSGERLDAGEEGDSRWELRRLEAPALGFAFEIGEFEIFRGRAGDIPVQLAVDPESAALIANERELLEAATGALEYFVRVFGPYPFPELTLVTAPRAFSQAAPGFVTLSTLMVGGGLLRALQSQDPRSVVAHEVAHQWWGHQVGWGSYRDQWMHEALASYASLLYARNVLGQRSLGPAIDWEGTLLEELENGRSVESLGPLVLGVRLESSRGSGYLPIVYDKGTLVIDMLAMQFGEDNFLKILRALLTAARHQELSTELFLDLVEDASGLELDAFAHQFVYGTGLPQVFYDSEVEPATAGSWQVRLSARLLPTHRFDCAVARLPDGSPDVVRRVVPTTAVDEFQLVVPVQVVVYNPQAVSYGEREEGDAERARERGNAVEISHRLLRGGANEVEVEATHEPRQVWIDAAHQVLALFRSARHQPKETLLWEARAQAAAGEAVAAEQTLRAALAAEVEVGPGLGEPRRERDLAREGHRLDAAIWFALSELYLDGRRLSQATEAFERSVAALGQADRAARQRSRRPDEVVILEARLALVGGDPEAAFRLLARPMLRERTVAGREGLAVLALAARQLGRTEEAADALDRAAELGCDMSLLETPQSP